MYTFKYENNNKDLTLIKCGEVNEKVTKIYFEEGIEKIYTQNCTLFDHLELLKEVYLPDSIEYIDSNFFRSLHKETKVYYKDNKDYIILSNELVYSNLGKEIKEIIIPYCQRIANNVFTACFKVENILLPNGLKEIGDNTFGMCESITNITIPSTVSSIGSECFNECIKLTGLVVEQGNKHYCSIDGSLYTKDLSEILYAPQFEKDIVFPLELKVINNATFNIHHDLINVTISSDLSYIGDYAFFNSKNLTNVYIKESIKTKYNYESCIGERAFAHCKKLENISIPSNFKTIKFEAFALCDSLKTIIIPNGVTTIEDNVFRDCINLETITLPNTLETLGSGVFSGCINLKNVILDDNKFYYIENNNLYNNKKELIVKL